MLRLLKISLINVKNIIQSKTFLLWTAAAFAYSMLWVLFVHPTHYDLTGYDFEIGRFLFVLILYTSVSIIRDDIRFNTIKTIFTGVFSRTEIMLSKVFSLVLLGMIFSIILEINNMIISCILYEKIGLTGFLTFNHLQLFSEYVVITLVMGSLMLLIISFIFNEKKLILFVIVFLSMINFYTAGITMLVQKKPEIAHSFASYMITPFYNAVVLTNGDFNIQSVVICLAWSIFFIITSFIIVNRREIK